jgi:hypothetical protein
MPTQSFRHDRSSVGFASIARRVDANGLALVLPTALVLVAACAESAGDDTAGAGADITAAAAGCTKADGSYTGPGKVTATTSGVRCYDDNGAVVGSMGAQASVTVVPGPKTGAGKNPNRLQVTGTNTVDHKALTCWLPTAYLCTAPSAAKAGADAGAAAEAGARSSEPPSIFCEFPVANGIRQAFIGDCRTVDGETTICLAPDEGGDARWMQLDASKNKCSSMSTNNNDASVCGTSLPDKACTSTEASSFVAQCATAGGTSKTAQSSVNGSIGAAHCDCACP